MVVSRYLFIFFLAFISLVLIRSNLGGYSFSYGSGDGRYLDSGDSFSEYIVRNTVKKNILHPDGVYRPIVTSGYSNEDYSYSDLPYSLYQSNIVIQTIPLSLFGDLVCTEKTEHCIDDFLNFIRILSVFIFCFLLILASSWLGKFYRIPTYLLILDLLFGVSAGVYYFGQNLYFLPFLSLIPICYIGFIYANSFELRGWVLLLTILPIFLRGYEFITTVTLLGVIYAVTLLPGKKLTVGVRVFAIYVTAFVAILFLHIVIIAYSSGDGSLTGALNYIKDRAVNRNMTTMGVPSPLSSSFFHEIASRMQLPAFAIGQSFRISQGGVILFCLTSSIINAFLMKGNAWKFTIFMLGAYISWYIFGYQHIMWHNMYDWYIFSLTMGWCFVFMLKVFLVDIWVLLFSKWPPKYLILIGKLKIF